MLPIRDRTICVDGTSLSIQADEYKYCSPRNDNGNWIKVEVGFIWDKEEKQISPPDTWANYADGPFPSDVYGYVPIYLVEEFIASHGGISSGPGIPK